MAERHNHIYNSKRIISIVLIALMIFGIIVPLASAEEDYVVEDYIIDAETASLIALAFVYDNIMIDNNIAWSNSTGISDIVILYDPDGVKPLRHIQDAA